MTEELLRYRRELDGLDDQLLDILARRLSVCRRVAVYKAESDIPMMQEKRVAEVKERAAAFGERRGLRAEFVRALYEIVIAEACRVEDEIIEGHQRG